MRKTLPVLAVVPLVVALLAPAAAATGPPVPWDGSAISSDWCGFEVELVTTGRTVWSEWVDAEGNIHYIANAMGVKAIVTNTATGKSLTLMNNGVYTYWQTYDDSVWSITVQGPWVWTWDPSRWFEDEYPGLWYSIGRLRWSGWDPPVYRQKGQLIDLCPLLAPPAPTP